MIYSNYIINIYNSLTFEFGCLFYGQHLELTVPRLAVIGVSTCGDSGCRVFVLIIR